MTSVFLDRLVARRGLPLRGRAILPGDKSLSHRAALLAGLAQGESRIENFLDAGVTRAMLRSLSELGVGWELHGSTLCVDGQGFGGLRSPGASLDCGNSATTMRLLAGAIAAAGIPAVLDGSPGLRARPMARIVQPLRAMGVPLEASGQGTAPLQFFPRPGDRPLRGVEHSLAVPSAQVKSCLLLAGLGAQGATVLHEPGVSRDHTERMLRGLGIPVETAYDHLSPHTGERLGTSTNVAPGPAVTTRLVPPRPLVLPPLDCVLPGDFSSAAFLVVAALIVPGSEVALAGVGLNPTRTGLLDALQAMGAGIRLLSTREVYGELAGDLLVAGAPLHGIEVDGALVARMIDEFPIFAVAAARATGRTVVRGAGELRHKESDRISALCSELRKLGVDIMETQDGFVIEGGAPFRGGVVQSHGDHRLAMALSVAGLASEAPVSIHGARAITESFPGFDLTLRELGGDIHLEA